MYNRYNSFASNISPRSTMDYRPQEDSLTLRKVLEQIRGPREEFPRSAPEFPLNTIPFEQLPQAQKPSFLDRYQEIAGNRPERSRLREAIENAPRREDFTPGKLDRVGAMLSGASAGWFNPGEGYNVARSILNRPFEEATGDYENRLSKLQAMAQMEDTDVQNLLRGLEVGENIDYRDRQFDWTRGVDERDFGEGVRRFDTTYNRGVQEFDTTRQDRLAEAAAARAHDERLLNLRGAQSMREIVARGENIQALEREKALNRQKLLEQKANDPSNSEALRNVYLNIIRASAEGIPVDDFIDYSGTIPVMKQPRSYWGEGKLQLYNIFREMIEKATKRPTSDDGWTIRPKEGGR